MSTRGMNRTLLALLVSPSLFPFALFWLSLHKGFRPSESAMVAVAYGGFTYLTALVAGLPAHRALQRAGLERWWHYALTGAVIGSGVLLLIGLASNRGKASLLVVTLFGVG